MESWLVPEPTVERLDLDEASWVDVVRGLVPRGDEIHDGLLSSAEWQQGQVFRYERWIDSPRQMAGYAAGTQPAIDEVDAWLRQRYAVRFGAPALALYRNERDSVAFHRDPRAALARRHGDRRAHVRRSAAVADETAQQPPPRPRRRLRWGVRLLPASGDLVVMGGATQARWLHAVPKVRTRQVSSARISVQWRYTSRHSPPRHQPLVLRRPPLHPVGWRGERL